VSDFIHRQVSRAVGGLDSQIRPHLPSVFEPARPDEGGPEPSWLDAEGEANVDGAPEGRAGSPGVPLPAPRRRAGDLQPAFPDQAQGASIGRIGAAVRGLPADTRAMSAPDQRGAPEVAPDGAPVPDIAAARPSPLLVPPDAPADLLAGRQSRALEAPPLLATPAALPAAVRALQAIRTRAALAGRDPSGRPQLADPVDGAPEEAPLLAPHTRTTVPVRSRAQSDHSARDAAAQTAIEVTIGRIEVRAAPAPAASTRASRSAAPRQASDLEVYLRQKGSKRS
jgi:hypothetical protein